MRRDDRDEPQDTATSASSDGTTTTTGGTTATTASEPQTLTIGTTQAYVDAVSTSADDWVKEAFQAEYDVDFEWAVRENELNDFIQRKQEGSPSARTATSA